jgi:hypothetical protein
MWNVKSIEKQKSYYYRVRSIEYHKVLVSKSRDYKNTLHRQFSEYQKAFIEKLRGLRTSDPKLYWSLLK